MFQWFNEHSSAKRVSNRPTVETARRIDVWNKSGWRPTRTGEYTISGTLLTVVSDAPMPRCQQRLYWLCPKCQTRRTRYLYVLGEQICCRECAGPLSYSIRYGDRAGRTLLIKKLRRKANISEQVFGPIPRRQPRYVKYARLAARIRREEAKLLGYIHDMVEGLHELRREAGTGQVHDT
jgi:hypothetical protein